MTYTSLLLTIQYKTLKRLREVSRFVCDVRVLRNGFCTLSNPTFL